MNYDYKAAVERMKGRRLEIIRQKNGQSVEGLPVLSEQKETAKVVPPKAKTQEKSE